MRKLKWVGVILALFLVAGCATMDVEVTLTDRLTYMYRVYNAQYEDYQSMAENPYTSEAQKKIMREKKPILDSLAILIPAFDKGIQNGTATISQEQRIYNLLNSLDRGGK